jgi:hypothetical protein
LRQKNGQESEQKSKSVKRKVFNNIGWWQVVIFNINKIFFSIDGKVQKSP